MKKKSLFICLIVVLADQFIKTAIDKSLVLNQSKTVIDGFLYYIKVYNYGASWNILSGMQPMLIVISIAALICLLYYQDSLKYNFRNVIAFGFIYGGLLGNLIDRFFRNYVIDFISVKFSEYSFPIFNLADMFLVLGFLILILSIIKGDDKHGKKSSRTRRRKKTR